MTGGYLSIDLSDVRIEGNLVTNKVLAHKKGLYNFIMKTKKPVYMILSNDLVSAIAKYLDTQISAFSNILTKPILFDTDVQGKNYFNITYRPYYNATLDENVISVRSIYLCVDTNDDIIFYEL